MTTTMPKKGLWRVPRPSSSPSPIEGCKQPINQSGLQVAPIGDVEQSQSEQNNPNDAEGAGGFSRNEWIEETEQVTRRRAVWRASLAMTLEATLPCDQAVPAAYSSLAQAALHALHGPRVVTKHDEPRGDCVDAMDASPADRDATSSMETPLSEPLLVARTVRTWTARRYAGVGTSDMQSRTEGRSLMFSASKTTPRGSTTPTAGGAPRAERPR